MPVDAALFIRKRVWRFQTYSRRIASRLRTGQWPPQIIFIHVPKCAGTSLYKHIKSCTGPTWLGRTVYIKKDIDSDKNGFADVAFRCQNAISVGGHISWNNAQQFRRDHGSIMITVLRDPYQRLRSLYYYITNLPDGKRVRNDPQLDKLIATMGPLEFFSSDRPLMRYRSDNFMLRQFAGNLAVFPHAEEDGQAMLERAKRNLASLDHVGFQETFDEDFPHIIDAIGLPRIKRAPRINVTNTMFAEPRKRARSREPFSDQVNAVIEPLIRWDRELYDFAVNELRPKQGG